jgi:DNA-binding NarL/FixJ family response regulator
MTTEEAHGRLKELSMEEAKILIIDGDVLMGVIIRDMLQKIFPKAAITVAEEFAHAIEDIDITLRKRFDIVFLDSDLSQWHGEDPLYSNWGFNLIPVIKEIRKETIIVVISNDLKHNEEGIKRGADMIFPKEDFRKNPLALL